MSFTPNVVPYDPVGNIPENRKRKRVGNNEATSIEVVIDHENRLQEQQAQINDIDQSALEAEIALKVDRAGDTMTGPLDAPVISTNVAEVSQIQGKAGGPVALVSGTLGVNQDMSLFGANYTFNSPANFGRVVLNCQSLAVPRLQSTGPLTLQAQAGSAEVVVNATSLQVPKVENPTGDLTVACSGSLVLDSQNGVVTFGIPTNLDFPGGTIGGIDAVTGFGSNDLTIRTATQSTGFVIQDGGEIQTSAPLVSTNKVTATGGFALQTSDVAFLPLLSPLVDQQLLSYNEDTARWVNEPLRLHSSTQYGRSYDADPWNQAIPDGATVNGLTFFSDIDNKDKYKDLTGTNTWGEIPVPFGIDLEIKYQGPSTGPLTVKVNGGFYSEPFSVDASTTIQNWVNRHKNTLKGLNIRISYNPGTLYPESIRFCAPYALIGDQNNLAVNSGPYDPLLDNRPLVISPFDWTQTVGGNPYTGVADAAQDHFLVRYEGEPYEGQFLQHRVRVNFPLTDLGQQQNEPRSYGLSLRRFSDDSIVGSEITIQKQFSGEEGQQHVFISYTAGEDDPFVTSGFYFALRNNSGAACEITQQSGSKVGILVQTMYERPVRF